MPTKKQKKAKSSASDTASTVEMISAWEQDPGSGSQPDGGQLIHLPVPEINSTSLPTSIVNPSSKPEAKVYPLGTLEFRYWNTAAALARGSKFWSTHLPGAIWQEDVGNNLQVNLDAGVDLNAFYDRAGLSFFHAIASGRTVFSCESPDVVCHEQGHAILDAIKPQLWDAASIEAAAFHESFGDISSILCALQLQTVRLGVLAETQGMLYSSSRLSRLAEQLGWAIRQRRPTIAEPDCLRNAVNSFFYRDPNLLPSDAPASSLSSEPHSFSRVFTAAFFEGLAGMFKLKQVQDEMNLLQVSNDMAQILISGIRAASVVPTFFSQVAVNMVHFAKRQFADIAYDQALKSTFVRHGVISPSTSMSFSMHALALTEEEAEATAQEKELPRLQLAIAEYDLGIDTIIVHSASEPKRFEVAGAALAIGSVVPPSQDEAAKAFVEDLLRRGRLKVLAQNRNKNRRLGITRPNEPETHETHTHELRPEGNDYVLRRVRIACSFHL